MQTIWPARLFHKTPSWVKDGEIFHIRIRCAPGQCPLLTAPETAEALLTSVRNYAQRGKWTVHLFLLMPDHLHALLVFPTEPGMVRTLTDWKRYQTVRRGIRWQSNFFDHRIRNPAELYAKAAYIRMNPVVKGLCAAPDDWPWKIG